MLPMETEELRAALKAAGDDYKSLRAATAQAQERLAPLMVEGLKDPNMKQHEVIELSGYSRESVRKLARKNGIEPE